MANQPRSNPDRNTQYDPIPDLAALIDGVQRAAEAGSDEGIRQELADLLTGPYARLRGFMLLDEPGWDYGTTENALRETLRYLNLEGNDHDQA